MEGKFWSNTPTPLPNIILSTNEQKHWDETNEKKENLGHEILDIIVSKTRGESLQQEQNYPTTEFQVYTRQRLHQKGRSQSIHLGI